MTLKYFTILVGAALLSACASQPEPQESSTNRGERAERPDRPARQSGTFIQPSGLLFASMDSNRDKRVTRSELEAGAKFEWASIGKNPGAIEFSKWSLETLGSTDAQPTFLSLDRDFNGVVYETEFMAGLHQAFERMDKNGDNVLDRSEMVIAVQARQGNARGRGGQQGRGGEGRGQGQRGQGQRGQGQRGQGQRPQR